MAAAGVLAIIASVKRVRVCDALGTPCSRRRTVAASSLVGGKVFGRADRWYSFVGDVLADDFIVIMHRVDERLNRLDVKEILEACGKTILDHVDVSEIPGCFGEANRDILHGDDPTPGEMGLEAMKLSCPRFEVG